MKKFITLLFVCTFLQINAQVVLQESFDDTEHRLYHKIMLHKKYNEQTLKN